MAKDFVKLRKLPGLDQVQTQLQSNIDTAFTQIQQEPVMRGVLIKDVELAAASTDNVIDHGLGRDYQGFIVARLNADARIWESPTSNPQPTTQLILRASAACTASVWVY